MCISTRAATHDDNHCECFELNGNECIGLQVDNFLWRLQKHHDRRLHKQRTKAATCFPIESKGLCTARDKFWGPAILVSSMSVKKVAHSLYLRNNNGAQRSKSCRQAEKVALPRKFDVVTSKKGLYETSFGHSSGLGLLERRTVVEATMVTSGIAAEGKTIFSSFLEGSPQIFGPDNDSPISCTKALAQSSVVLS